MNSLILDRLLLAAKRNRLPHALLFSGNSKPSLNWIAKELASYLLSDRERVSENNHPDLFWLKSEKQEISIELVRELQVWIAKGPYESTLKVAVIEEAEKLNRASQNALLKTLEEPPPHGKLILLSHLTDRLLPTILSRVQVIRLPDEETAEEQPAEWVQELKVLLQNPNASFESIFSFTEQLSKERGELKYFFKEFEQYLKDQMSSPNISNRQFEKVAKSFQETLQAESDLLRHYGNIPLTLDSLLSNWFTR